MNFSDKLKALGKTVSQFAPLLGGVIEGPAGAIINSIVAEAFGGDANKPEDLEKLIRADPEAAVKLKAIETSSKVELQKLVIQGANNILVADTSRIEAVNITMQAEAKSDDKWQKHWRPYWGFITANAFFLQILTVIYVSVFETASAPGIIVALGAMDIFWGVPLAILGVSAYHRGKEKRVLAGETIQPLINLIKK